ETSARFVSSPADPFSACQAVAMSGSAELDSLLRELNSLRTSVLNKLSGLTEDEARRSTVRSGTNLAGLIQHLTFVEGKWFEQIAAGRKPSRGKRTMSVDQEVTLAQLRSDYRAAWRTSDEIVARIGDPDAPIDHNGTRDLRSVIVSVISETARHA